MYKKLICAGLIALTLCGCEKNADNAEETTSLTLTVSVTEENTPPAPPETPEPVKVIEFALFDPFYEENQLYKGNADVRAEMLAAAENFCDYLLILEGSTYGFPETSKYYQNFADLENPLETDPMGDYTFCPLNAETAADEEELFALLRGAFTENYISDGELRSTLFENDEPYVPRYKTIDGTLCVLNTYMGMKPSWYPEKTTVVSYGDTSAEIAVYGSLDPAVMAFVKLEKSEKYGWRIDSYEVKDYCPEEAGVLYNGIVLKTETLNKILGGGNTPENAKTVEIDGKTYTETDLDMTVAEMGDFIDGIFGEGGVISERNKYVTNVYIEQDGVIYRRDSMPRLYSPEMQLSAFVLLISVGGNPGDWGFSCEQEFYDSVKDETFTQLIHADCLCDPDSRDGETGFYDTYYHIYIDGLPIREY